LSDPDAKVIVVGIGIRWPVFGVDHLAAASAAQGRQIVVGVGAIFDCLVREVIVVLTSMYAPLCAESRDARAGGGQTGSG
jgi:putative resolvase